MKRITKTIIATLILLFIFFIQGAAVVMGNVEGNLSILIRSIILWISVICTLLFYRKELSNIGFRKPVSNVSKRLLLYIPVILIALLHLVCGINTNSGIVFIFLNLIFVLSIGFIEEIYFRGIILKIWLDKNTKKAIIISSILFAICHLMNVMGGAGIIEVILQICFAFVYGVVLSYIFIISKSIWPCIIIHAFHDYLSFISLDASLGMNILIGTIQFIILIVYAIYLSKQIKYKKD